MFHSRIDSREDRYSHLVRRSERHTSHRNSTGTTNHQIRRHLKHISHPLIGDVRYGKGPINRHYRASYGLERTALHACALRFPHPAHGEWLEVRAPVAPELVACFAALGFEPAAWERAFELPEPELTRVITADEASSSPPSAARRP